jgi:hypothetical protein
MKTLKNMMPYLYALTMIGSSFYNMPKNLQSQMGGGYPTRKGEMQKNILTLHRKSYSNKYNRIAR